jgi:hypothetical protein
VDAIAQAYRPKVAERWEEVLPRIVRDAAEMRFSDFARDLQALADRFDPKEAEDRLTELVAGRRVQTMSAADYDSYGMVRWWLDPIAYPVFGNEHDRIVDQLFKEDWAAAKELLGRDPEPGEVVELTRTRDQRAADALVEMARRSKALAGGTAAAAAEVVLYTTLETYEAALRHLATGDPLVIPDRGFCETDDGVPLSPVAAVYASVLGRVRRIVYSADDEVISYGQSRDLFSPVQKAVARATYRRCTHLYGCDRTGPLLQTDHVVERQDGGATDVTNGKPMDGPHNRWKSPHRHDPPRPGVRIDSDQRRGPPRWC